MKADLLTQIRLAGLPEPALEVAFHPTRKWRWDYAWPALMLAVEIQGGGWVRGRHHRPAGYAEDCVKHNEAILLGWTVLPVTTDQVRSGQALEWIQRAIERMTQEAVSE